MGSWKIMAISVPRMALICRPFGRSRARSTGPFRLANRISPLSIHPGGWIRPMMARDVTDLPQPLSPTTARVSPGAMARSIPSTACATPASVMKDTRRSRMARRSVMVMRSDPPGGARCAGRGGP